MIGGMLAGALIFAAGALAGRFLPARRRGPKPAEPFCGCEHHISYHDPKTAECHGDGNYIGNGRYSRCTCRRYSGPQPLPEFYAPEIPG